MDWTKAWSKKYPILAKYSKTVQTEKYSTKIKEMIEELKTENGLNNQDAMLVLKDILYKEYIKFTQPERKQHEPKEI